MGMPLSRFSQLSRAMQDPETRNQLSSFKVHCLILHKPSDCGFARYMRNNFELYDNMTGNNVLFTTFIRNAEQHKLNYDKGLKENWWFEHNVDEEKQIDHFINLLGTDFRPPLIVLSTNPYSHNVVIIKVKADKLQQTLSEITNLTAIGRFESGRLDAIKRCGHWDENHIEYCHLNDSFLQCLYEASAANNLYNFQEDGYSTLYDVKAVIKDAVARKKRRIARTSDFSKKSQIITEYYSYIKLLHKPKRSSGALFCIRPLQFMPLSSASRFMQAPVGGDAISPARREEEKPYIIPLRTKSLMFLEKGNRKKIKQYNDVIKDIMEEPDEELINIIGEIDDEHDFSNAAAMLGAITTSEMYTSVVQLIRNVYGIPMPEFYCKYCPQHKCMISNGIKDVDFNANQGKGNWVPPSLGDAAHALENQTSTHPEAYHLQDYPFLTDDDYIMALKIINGVRNPGSHGSYVSEKHFAKQFEKFQLMLDKYFEQMDQIRQDMASK